jgi:hypothetical protein
MQRGDKRTPAQAFVRFNFIMVSQRPKYTSRPLARALRMEKEFATPIPASNSRQVI